MTNIKYALLIVEEINNVEHEYFVNLVFEDNKVVDYNKCDLSNIDNCACYDWFDSLSIAKIAFEIFIESIQNVFVKIVGIDFDNNEVFEVA